MVEKQPIDREAVVEEIVYLLNLTQEELSENQSLKSKNADAKDIHLEARQILELRKKIQNWLAITLVSGAILLGDIVVASRQQGNEHQYNAMIIGVVCVFFLILSLFKVSANAQKSRKVDKLFVRDAFRLGFFVNSPQENEKRGLLEAVAEITSIATRIQVTSVGSDKPKRDPLIRLADDGELEGVPSEGEDRDSQMRKW